jgi:hypothetical protein
MRKLIIAFAVLALAEIASSQCVTTITYPTGALPNAPINALYPSWDHADAPWTRLTATVLDNGVPCGTIVGWSVVSGSLPPGLSIATVHSQWYIVGTVPTGNTIHTVYNFTLQATDSNGGYATQPTSITVTQTVPTFSPALNAYYSGNASVGYSAPTYAQVNNPNNSQTVMLGGTGTSKICYTLNFENTLVPSYQDTEPTTNGAGICTGSTLDYSVTGPITVSQPTLIRAVATVSGKADSNIAWGFYDVVKQGPAQLPVNYITTTLTSSTYSCLSGAVNKTVKMSNGDYSSLSAAIAAIPTDTADGTLCETITVDDNSTGFVSILAPGDYFTIQNTMQPGKWVQFRPSGYASLVPQGTDAASCSGPDGNLYSCANSPATRTHMWKILKQVNTLNYYSYDTAFAICGDNTITISGACNNDSGISTSGVIFTGLDMEWQPMGITCVPGTSPCAQAYDGFLVGDYTNMTPPSRIIFDRDSFDTASGAYDTYRKTDIQFEGCNTCAVVDSYFEHNWEPANNGGVAAQGQDVGIIAGPGPYKIVNNWLGGTPSENFMIGGSTGGIVNQGPHNCYPNCPNTIRMGWPHDIEFRRNIVSKNPAVMNNPNCTSTTMPACSNLLAAVANLFEFKGGAERLLNEGNIYLNSWAAGNGGNGVTYYQQNGSIAAFKIDQNGPPWCPLCTVGDVTFRYNYSSHSNMTVAVIGQDQGGKQFPVMQRVTLYGNLFTDVNHQKYGNTLIYEFGYLISSGGGGINSQALQAGNPGPWYYSILNSDSFSTLNNSAGTGLTWLVEPLGCEPLAPIGVFPYFTFNDNFSANYGKTGTQLGHEYLDGDCEYSPYILFENAANGGGAFPWSSLGDGNAGTGHTGSIMANFQQSNSGTCDTSDNLGGWGEPGPGICPALTALNTYIADYTDCAAATGTGGAPNSTLSACATTSGYSNVGPSLPAMLNARRLGNDYYASPPVRHNK